MRALTQTGVLRPTARQISEQAGVSLRTVWQHFSDLESLLAEAGKRDLEIALGYGGRIETGLPLTDRITALVDQRARLFEDITPVWRAGRLQEPFSPQIAASRARLMEHGRRQLERLFAAELAECPQATRGTLLSALELASCWTAWDALRDGQRLSCDQARTTVITVLTALLATRPTG